MLGILGWVLVFLGAIWLGQGVGLIPGSFMTGSTFWAIAGGVCVLVGGGLLAGTRRKR